MHEIFIVIGICIALMILERLIPDQTLPPVRTWWSRIIFLNSVQLGVVILGGKTWELALQRYSLFRLSDEVTPFQGGVIAYVLIVFVFYWWHRWRHEVRTFWLLFHQVHHSPVRIETITSFYKHPFEIFANSIIISGIIYTTMGLTIESAAPSFRGVEGFASSFEIEIDGRRTSITPRIYQLLAGPYNRRNVYGAAIAGGPMLTGPRERRMIDAILSYGLCGNGPLLREFGLRPARSSISVRITSHSNPPPGPWNLPIDCSGAPP